MAGKSTISPADRPIPNAEDLAERITAEHVASPEEEALAEGEPPHNPSLTAVAAEALQTGIYPPRENAEIPSEDDVLRAGDPNVDPISNLFTGDELPGGSMSTPDQNNVDDVGRIIGVMEEGTGSLRTAEELAEKRDRRRWDMEPLSPKT